MSVVVDASVCVALLVDNGPSGRWAETLVSGQALSVQQIVLVETTNVLRRLIATGTISDLDGSTAHRDLLSLPIALYPFELLADRVWSLRHNLSSYDACYVALAEMLDVPLATLDRRLVNAPGPRCAFLSVG